MNQDTVILVHGFAGSPFAMVPLARRLMKLGYRVVNWGYPSLKGSLKEYIADLARELERLDGEEAAGKLHVVGHSMGAIVAREAVRTYCPRRVGRVVLMAPPLRGSKMADRLRPFLQVFAPLALEMSYVKDFKGLDPLPKHVEVGVMAARFDHLVGREDTMHAGHVDHMVVNWSHTLTMSPKALTAVGEFLKTGAFGGTVRCLTPIYQSIR